MHSIKMITIAALLGCGYQFITTILGAKIAGRFWPEDTESDRNWKILTALAFGLLFQVAVTSVVLLALPGAVKYVFWACVLIVFIDARRSANFIALNGGALLLAAAYGLVCYLVLVSFHFGVPRGANLLWTIYRLTIITPGDSPQGLVQAQYLAHGHQLINLQDFSLFDRPFFGGIISLEQLSAALLPPGLLFDQFPENQTFTYIALWIWLNAGFTFALTALVRRATVRSHALICILVLASPGIAFNTIGAWPKLLAAYFACCAALLALEKRWFLAVMLSGFSFYTHGSFLWSHLATSGVLIMYVMLSPEDFPGRYLKSLGLTVVALAFPALWFGAEHLTHATSPLTTYYLYGVTPYYGLTHSIEEIARAYYPATTPDNLAILPFINLIKSILPLETLHWFTNFSYMGADVSFRSFLDSLFMTQVDRPWFVFCLTGGAIAFFGLREEITRNWELSLAVVVFFSLPLIPGFGLYRRDDHFLEAVMMFSILPLIMAFSIGLNALSRTAVFVVTSLMFIEYGLVYWSRYPTMRYGAFHEYYLLVSLLLLAAAYLVALRLIVQDKEDGIHA